MKQQTFLIASLGVALVAGFFSMTQAVAGPVLVEPEPVLPRLRVSAGATVRSLGADFRLDGGHRSLGAAPANAGLFSGGSDRVIYDDGSVGPSFGTVAGNTNDGTAFGTIQSASQVFNTGRIDGNGDPIFGARFRGAEASSVTVPDEETSVGPYLQLTYSLLERDGLLLNAVTGWSWVRFGLGSGNQLIRDEHTYTYDTTLVTPLPTFPFTDPASPAGNGNFIIDPNNPAIAGLGLDPRDQITAVGVARADLDVDLHEIPLGLEFGQEFGKLDVLLTAGLTLNVIAFDLNSQFASGTDVQRWRNEGNEIKAGGYLGLVGRYPLCASGKVFAEARGSYRWVDSTEVSAGFATAEIDPSSWEGGLGIGILW
jgi:hypothetical protein